MRNRLTERDLSRIVRRVVNEQQETTDDGKSKLIQVMMDKLNSMKDNQNFTADDVCEVLTNNCNHFKNKTDIFAK
jgi:Cdc6-like AAA superfamily ATPase